jgi:hypothetical protein
MNPVLPPESSFSNWICCRSYHDRDELHRVLLELNLEPVQKQIILSRYVYILEHLSKRVRMYSRLFYTGHIVITVGSLLVPALLSIQNSSATGNTSFSTQIYWTTFILSLMVTMCNGLLALFKIDKKYYFLHTTLERLRTEGWQYLGLTGRYSGHLVQNQIPNHQNQFVFFTHQIEKIKMKQIEEEYYKSDEKATQQPQVTASRTTHELYPPSPEQPLASLANEVPDPVKDAVQSIIQSQKISDLTNIVIHPAKEIESNISMDSHK